MSNGLPRTQKYARLPTADHLLALDDDLDTLDANREILLRTLNESAEKRYESMNTKMTWVLTSFMSLIFLVCGTLLAVVIRN